LVHQAEPKPERTSRGPRDSAAFQELLVRTRPALRALRILANQVRGRREPFEIVGREALIPIRCRQEYVRVRPRAAAERVSTPVEVVSRRHLFRATLLDRRA
jgi:hypothetical protein